MDGDVLAQFTPATREWFTGAFVAPTPAQLGAWKAIASGDNALVVAPTGSGKTLAAFLWSLDTLLARPREQQGTRILYISPLKALGVDVERNLRAPLIGLTQTALRLGESPPKISVGVRSGDTPAAQRRALLKSPPDVLITTPESLFLMLTSAARESLTQVETVIIDEVHAVAGSKRGAHLAVSLERLDEQLRRNEHAPAQRIGLSATVQPLDRVARFLSGEKPCTIVAPKAQKTWDLTVSIPVEDMTNLVSISTDDDGGLTNDLQANASIWPHVEERITDLVLSKKSTIVFANSRRLAERLTSRLNEIYERRLLDESSARLEAAEDDQSLVFTHQSPAGSAKRAPTEVSGQAGYTLGSATALATASEDLVLARAHHGSVSKEQRAQIEDDLKSGRLRCVVATSSLELGIDMGLVDLVVQVESPPSVASGLQRVGRAGHQVGEVSEGVLFPKHRADLVHTAVTVERMLDGEIEPLSIPANPLDILAQQTVAAAALDVLDAEQWFNTVRRSAPFASLPRSAYEATLDLLAGRYPSDEFATLRPRIVWDRNAGTLTGRPGAQRLAVTSGGTIPDRGLFGVFLVGAEEGKNSKRVGELDEEMVYESRVGDVFALGATSWRIEDITHDRVLVSPAFGQPGKLPFWKGDSLGRPAVLGRAVGAFTRDITNAEPAEAIKRCTAIGLDTFAANNLLAYLGEQREAAGLVPDEKTFLIERFHDELGDWRIVLHSPLGMPVHAPWALAVGARLQERYGIDGSAMAADDGIVVRVPMMDDDPPGADLFLFDPDEMERVVTDQVGGSALFAARFRECAARALLLPRQNPGRRSPLWQQRQRSAQLLDVAKKYPSFPIILETVRECLQDVYDLPELKTLLRQIEQRKIRIVETTTNQPSPFARSLLFGYVATFLYEGDSPLAERRAAALSLDPALLNELLGRTELRDLLDERVIVDLENQLQRLSTGHQAKGVEGVADLIRQLGPLSDAEIAARMEPSAEAHHDASLAAEAKSVLVRANRAIVVNIAGQPRLAAVEDSARLRDSLGTPVPIGVPVAFLEPVPDPLGDVVSRYARTHGPFTAAEVASRYGLGVAVVNSALSRLQADGRVVQGEFRPVPAPEPDLDTLELQRRSPAEILGVEWCDAQVLSRIRQRSLAALRSEVEPVDRGTFGRFLPAWQHIIGAGGQSLCGTDGLLTVIDQLAGTKVPVSALEPLVLGRRIRDYRPAMLDELLASGDVLWQGNGSLAGNDGWVSLHLAGSSWMTLAAEDETSLSATATKLLEALAAGGAYFFGQLRTAVPTVNEKELSVALWELVWAGKVSNDTLSPLRALLSGGHTAHKQRPTTPRLRAVRAAGRYRDLARPRPEHVDDQAAKNSAQTLAAEFRRTASTASLESQTTLSGRWYALDSVPPTDLDAREQASRANGMAEWLLDRYGVITRGSVVAEGMAGGFGYMYKVLSQMEEKDLCRRGYFIEKLGAAQFATAQTVNNLRSYSQDFDPENKPNNAVILAACDPANPYGAALVWPQPPGEGSGHRPGRKAGALVVLVDGALVLYVERGGKTMLCFSEELPALVAAALELVRLVKSGSADKLVLEKVNGGSILDTALGTALMDAGAYSTPRGIRVRP